MSAEGETRRGAPCHICGEGRPAGVYVGWPGRPETHPAPIRKLRADAAAARAAQDAENEAARREERRPRKVARVPQYPDRLRICRTGGECEAQAIARIERAAHASYPFSDANVHLAPRVAEILGRPAAAERSAPRPDPEKPQPAPAQGALL